MLNSLVNLLFERGHIFVAEFIILSVNLVLCLLGTDISQIKPHLLNRSLPTHPTHHPILF